MITRFEIHTPYDNLRFGNNLYGFTKTAGRMSEDSLYNELHWAYSSQDDGRTLKLFITEEPIKDTQ